MRKVFKSPLFWITLLSFLFSILFIFFWDDISKTSFQDQGKRLLYASIFFLMVLIAQLSYLFLTKEEERETRRKTREAKREERKKQRELKRLKKSAIKELRKTFYKALNIIKTNHIYKNRASHNYELPWYLVLGGDDAEHKAILDNSGLDFPVNIEYRDDDAETKSYFKWFFSEEGVFVSVPKQYITLDKNSTSNPIWLEFLRLFKKERWRRPINGIILSINAQDILKNDELDSNEFAKVVREKLHGISQTFSAKIPIYMMVTGTNVVPGFTHFFNTLTSEEKREVLGVTFKDHIEEISQELIEVNMSNLIQKLEYETLESIHNSWEPKERKDIFLFLDQFQLFLGKVSHFSNKIFSKSRYSTPLMLRGIYFSNVGAKENTSSSQDMVTYRSSQMMQSSNALFVPKVFERVILSETQLANVHDAYRKRFAYFWLALFGILGLLFAAIIYFWTDFIKEENQEVTALKDIYAEYVSLKKDEKEPSVVLQRKAHKPKDAVQIGKLGGKHGEDLNFQSSQASLTIHAKRQLLKISDRIQTFDESTKVKIIGHTDSIGSQKENLKLSNDRAKAVQEFFEEQGISKNRLSSIGEGEGSPIANNQTVEGRSLNRRVEVFAYGIQNQAQEQSYKESYTIDNKLSELQRILGMLDALHSMIRDEDIAKQLWKPGYQSIQSRDNKVKKLYRYALKTLLLPKVSIIIEKEVLDHLDDKSETQGNLKAYLMLANNERRKKEYLEDYMIDRWDNELEDSEIGRLNTHFATLLDANYTTPSLRQRTIFRARRKLTAHAGKAGLVYKNLQDIASTQGLYDFQFLEILDAFPDSLKGTEYRIPGFYTKEGYEKIILLKAKFLINQSMSKSWILGDKTKDIKSKEVDRVYNKILSLYFRDYRRHWNKALSSITIPSYTNAGELAAQLELLSSGASPVVEVLRELKKHTYLLTPKEKAEALLKKKRESGMNASDVLGNVGAKIDRYQRVGTKLGANFAGDKYVFDLRNTFKPYHELIGEKGEPSRKLQMALRHTEKIYQSMLGIDTAINPKESAFKIINSNQGEGKNRSFSMKSTLLPAHILEWYNSALSDSWGYLVGLVNGYVDKTYNDKIWSFYKSKIEGKFPLALGSKSDIAIDDFKAFFQKDGMLDKFYDKYVMPFVNIDTQSGTFELRDISGAKIAITKSMVKSMLAAKKIQKLFFEPQSGVLHLAFMIKAKSLSPSLSAMDILYEDQDIIYEHGPEKEVKFVWPTKYQDSLAKFTLYNLRSERVVKIRGEGPWAILKLFQKLKRKMKSKERMIVSYKKGGAAGSFEVKGNAIILFTTKSPFKNFKLKKK